MWATTIHVPVFYSHALYFNLNLSKKQKNIFNEFWTKFYCIFKRFQMRLVICMLTYVLLLGCYKGYCFKSILYVSKLLFIIFFMPPKYKIKYKEAKSTFQSCVFVTYLLSNVNTVCTYPKSQLLSTKKFAYINWWPWIHKHY